jgi:ribonuclease P protein component
MLRLKKRWQFLRVAATGHKWVAPSMVVQTWSHDEGELEEIFRVGFTVSKKVGGAIERNRVKRRLKAAAAKVLPDHARTGFDFVLIGRKKSLKKAFPSLVQDLKTALIKLDAYNE